MLREARGVALEAAARGGDQRPALGGPLLEHGAAGAGRIDDELRARRDGGEQLRELLAVDVGPGQIQLVGFAVVAAVADEHHDDAVGGLRTRAQRSRLLTARRASRPRLQQRDAARGRRAPRNRRERRGVLRELLLIGGLAAEAADDEVVELGVCRRAAHRARATRRQPPARSQPPPVQPQEPLARLQQQQQQERIGMFQRSSTWRSTLPASEKLTASGKRLTSSTAK